MMGEQIHGGYPTPAISMEERLINISDQLPLLITTLGGQGRFKDLAALWLGVGQDMTPKEWLNNKSALATLCTRAQALTPELDLTVDRLRIGLCIAAMKEPDHSSDSVSEEDMPFDVKACRLLAQHTLPCAPCTLPCAPCIPSERRSRCLPQTLVSLLCPSVGEDSSPHVVQSLVACLLKHGCTRLGDVDDPMPLSEQEGDSEPEGVPPAAHAHDLPSIADTMAGILLHEFNIDVATGDLGVAARFVYYGRLQRTELDYSLTEDPRTGDPLKPGTKQVMDMNSKLDTGKGRSYAEFMHPIAYGSVYGDEASGGGTSGGGTSAGGEQVGGSAVEKKKPRLGEASQDNVK